MPPKHIAILGGGISGLSAAFHLSRRFPSSSITLVEKSKRLGGWTSSSERVQLPNGGGSVLLEGGPRTLLPTANSVLELINLLGLSESVITTSKSSPAAKKRFLHVPGTPGIYPIPSIGISFMWAPLKYFIAPGIMGDIFQLWNRPEGVLDESVDAFLNRRFHPLFSRVCGSALVHGIYAADSRLLSVRTAFPKLWELEEKGGRGGVIWAMLFRSKAEREREKQAAEENRRRYELGDTTRLMDGVSVYSFRNGMNTLANALEQHIGKNPNIRVLRDTEITSLAHNADHGFDIETNNRPTIRPSHVVSALPLSILDKILPQSHPLPYLTTNPSSSVTAINLVFPGAKIYPPGFGYLVSRPEAGYSADDSGILGVTFDSSSLSAQDSLTPGEKITKVTVMLGGPYRAPETSLPVVLAYLRYHLNRRKELPEPLVTRMWQHKDCIPTPLPGHLERMDKLKEALNENGWDGRMEVIGAGMKGVSVGDCVESGKVVGMNWQ